MVMIDSAVLNSDLSAHFQEGVVQRFSGIKTGDSDHIKTRLAEGFSSDF